MYVELPYCGLLFSCPIRKVTRLQLLSGLFDHFLFESRESLANLERLVSVDLQGLR